MSFPSNRVLDAVVFGLTLVISVVVGMYHASKGHNNSTLDYFLAGQKMKTWPVVLSLLVTFQSSIVVIGTPAEVYIHGYIFCFHGIGLGLAFVITSRITPALFHPLGLKSVHEYFSLRYDDKKVRLFVAWLNIMNGVILTGIVMIGPAIALKTVSNIPEWGTVLLLAATAVLYSTLGGIKAVIWTDVFQFIVIMAGCVVVLVKGTLDAGGLVEVFEVNKASGRLDIEFSPNPFIRHSVWALVIGTAGQLLGLGLSSQGVQRSNSTPTERDARSVFQISVLGFVVMETLMMTQGLVAFAYFSKLGCDPFKSKEISNPNELIPFFVMKLFDRIPGLSGLFFATLVSASLSTISSTLNSMSVIATEDLVKPTWQAISDSKLTLVAKAVVPLTGILGVGAALLTMNAKGSLSQLIGSILGATGGPVTGAFLLAIFFACSTTEGVLLGGVVGIAFTIWLSIGYNTSTTRLVTSWLPLGPVDNCPAINATPMEPLLFNNSRLLTTFYNSSSDNHVRPGPAGIDWLYSVSYHYFGLMAIIVTVSFGVLISLVSRKVLKRYKTGERNNEKYTLSFSDTYLCCVKSACVACPSSYRHVAKQATVDNAADANTQV